MQGKDLMLLQLHFRSPRLRLLSGCDPPLSALASSCSHFVSACSELSGCKSLIQQRCIRLINSAAKIVISFQTEHTVIDLNTAMSCQLSLCFRLNTETQDLPDNGDHGGGLLIG